jgi:hypothetical protein
VLEVASPPGNGRKSPPKKIQSREEGSKIVNESLEENRLKKIQFQTARLGPVSFHRWQFAVHASDARLVSIFPVLKLLPGADGWNRFKC